MTVDVQIRYGYGGWSWEVEVDHVEPAYGLRARDYGVERTYELASLRASESLDDMRMQLEKRGVKVVE